MSTIKTVWFEFRTLPGMPLFVTVGFASAVGAIVLGRMGL